MSGCAAIQYKPPKGNPAQALAELAELVNSAGEQGAELIVCPEMASTGYLWSGVEQIIPYAEDPLGATFQTLSPLAKKHSSWIVCGYIERDSISKSQHNADHPALYNSALIISPQGQLIHSYRKVLLYEADVSWAQAGSKRVLIDTDLGTLFPLICMDLNDPMFSFQLLDGNPSIIPFCTNWLDESSEILSYWKMRLRGWKGWFVAANTWGSECSDLGSSTEQQEIAFRGESVILNPEGRVMAQASSEGNCVLYSSWA